MKHVPLNSVDEITPEWLTRVLVDGGYLTSGSVSDVEIHAHQSIWASNAVLRLRYSADAQGEKPTKLFFKLCTPGAGTFGVSEVVYYSTVAAEINEPPIPRCYQSAYRKENGQYHLLLEDLSDTHAAYVEPSWELANGTMFSLAQLHASWWNNPKLPLVGEYPDRSKIEKYVTFADGGLAPMFDEIGADLPQDWHTLIHKIFETHREKIIERARDGRDLTCIHGDPNPGNILSPINGRDKVYLIDRQPFDWSLTTWLGVSDLTYIMVLTWDTEMRRSWEKPLLENYHQHLARLGVRDYSLDRLWIDYRLCVLQSLYVPVSRCVDPIDRVRVKWLWWSQLQRAMIACADLKCIELL